MFGGTQIATKMRRYEMKNQLILPRTIAGLLSGIRKKDEHKLQQMQHW